LDRVVAIKVPRAGNMSDGQEVERFLREARSVAQLKHPAIVSIYEVGQRDGIPYLVSDFVEGVTLSDRLTAQRFTHREAAELIATIAEALQYAHERGIVHRDIKPSNVMLETVASGQWPVASKQGSETSGNGPTEAQAASSTLATGHWPLPE